MSGTFWKVAVDAPLPEPLTYRIPSQLEGHPLLKRGMSVRVPLGRRSALGVLLSDEAESDVPFQIKDITEILEGTRPRLPEPFLKWLEWVSRYYLHPIGQVVECAFPPLKKAESARQKSRKGPVTPRLDAVAPPSLTAEQNQVVQAILSQPGFGAHLLHGVTGSGKTEVYIRLLENLIAEGRQGIVLVPEISLTPQLTQRFVRRLGDAVAVIHSGLTPREKTDQWWAMVEGEKKVLIGARSALFCPVENLGLIIIDEEHEGSFKQDEKLKYHARDAAVVLAKQYACPIVLGSATPSLETWTNATSGRYRLHEMKKRVEDRPMPTIEIIDLRTERDERKQAEANHDLPFWLSGTLYSALRETHESKKQSALFLNRRGVAQSVVCPACGFVPECPNCEVSLTLHGKNHLLCHYCEFHQTLGPVCSDCREGEPRPLGLGTELVESDLIRLFPGARVARMDRDEISTREELEDAIAQIESGEVDFIVGTQMIAKGLDFPNLILVGLVMADIAFNLPDFRASERAFQLLTQVAGRSGRHVEDKPGRVLIQTYNPDHPSIQFTQAHDYAGFARFEMSFREQLQYPPFWRLAAFRIVGLDFEKTQRTASLLRTRAELLQAQQIAYQKIELLGPAPCPLGKLRNNFRFQFLVKSADAANMGRFCKQLLADGDWIPSAVKVSVDIDAMNLL
ncbi:MAG: primosomal protein N' [Bdellovibrionaceae bacterium]|nr:primosomal protein N' [Pseudobdellovibrionaceae bacterium]